MRERLNQPEITELHRHELIKKFKDPAYLLTVEEVTQAFKDEDYNDFEWIWSKFFSLKEKNPVFELLTKEFVESFSNYLEARIQELSPKDGSPVTILEVNAGNGRLTHFLKQRLDNKVPGKFVITATDSYSGEFDITPFFPVEAIDYKKALQIHKPQIVISCWMPYATDFSQDFRSTPSVQEYIVIGENEVVGDPWKTWGLEDTYTEDKNELPPFEKDGFEKNELKGQVTGQICRTDDPGEYFHSSTVSFRRKK